MEQMQDGSLEQQEVLSGQEALSEEALNTEQAAKETPNYVSRDEIMQMLGQTKRELQGLVDKNVSRLDGRIAAAIAATQQYVQMNKEAGIEMTPDQIRKVQDAQISKAYQSIGQPSENVQAAQPMQAQEQVNPVNQAAIEMLQEAGFDFDERDPEVNLIDQKTTNAYQYLKSVEKAIAAKKQRLSKPKGNPAAVPNLGGGTTSTLEAQYKKEMLAARGQGVYKGNEIKDKYRKQGLNVDFIELTPR